MMNHVLNVIIISWKYVTCIKFLIWKSRHSTLWYQCGKLVVSEKCEVCTHTNGKPPTRTCILYYFLQHCTSSYFVHRKMCNFVKIFWCAKCELPMQWRRKDYLCTYVLNLHVLAKHTRESLCTTFGGAGCSKWCC